MSYWRIIHRRARENSKNIGTFTGFILVGCLTVGVVWFTEGYEAATSQVWLSGAAIFGLIAAYVVNLFRAARMIHEENLRNISVIDNRCVRAERRVKELEEENLALKASAAGLWAETGEDSFTYLDQTTLFNETGVGYMEHKIEFKTRPPGDYTVTCSQVEGENAYGFSHYQYRPEGFTVRIRIVSFSRVQGDDEMSFTWQAMERT